MNLEGGVSGIGRDIGSTRISSVSTSGDPAEIWTSYFPNAPLH